MSYFERQTPRGPGFFVIFILMLISAVLGGVAAVFVAPAILGDSYPFPPALPGPGSGAEEPRAWDWPQDLEHLVSPGSIIAEKVSPAVVSIVNYQQSSFFRRVVPSSGSGVIFDSKNGYIVTNYHVISGADRIEVIVKGTEKYEGKLIGGDAQTDLAVVQIKGKDLEEALFGDSDQLKIGELAIAIGSPLGTDFDRSVTQGVISALNRQISVSSGANQEITLNVIQTDAAINPGNSGGALVNGRGEVIGINSVKVREVGVEGIGFAIPINGVKPIVDELLNKGYVSRPFIGIYDFQEITSQMAQWYDLPEGIFVGGIVPGGPAEKAGLQVEDIIVQIEGKNIKTATDLQESLGKQKVGNQIAVRVVRKGKAIDFDLTLGEMPRS